ncbi:MAG: glutamate--tRNA ligase [Bacteroidales bacterium]|nr:glutamate--tRNA ligase [Bacteroidales bacterium]
MDNNRRVRVRFAPSPTGALHIGGVRTALYNYLFARHNGGDFLLRIEDTDSNRFVPGAEAYIIESLKWCGIQVDEGIEEGGPHAPYRQSERKPIYKKYADQLVESGNAYYAFDSAEELDALRKEAEAEKKVFAYDAKSRTSLKNSLTMPAEEVAAKIAAGENYVIRFKMPESEIVEMDDLIRGHISVNTATLDDKVLYKSADGLPTYHLANIVDDHLMEISHVIRGEEWLMSLPLHYLLYRAFGWTDTQPLFAHLPLLLKPQGQGKLSKRDGDKFGFPVFPLEWHAPDGEVSMGYREQGYFPQAFINMLALLGWNPGTEKEIFSMDELIASFSLEKVSKSGARFSHDKAKWFNGQYMRRADDSQLGAQLAEMLAAKGIVTSVERASKAVSLIKERATFPADLLPLTLYMFEAPESYDEKSVNKSWKKDDVANLLRLREKLEAMDEIVAETAEPAIHEWIVSEQISMGRVMNALRIALLGIAQGPSIFAIAEFIGKEETLRRIDTAVEKLAVSE